MKMSKVESTSYKLEGITYTPSETSGDKTNNQEQ